MPKLKAKNQHSANKEVLSAINKLSGKFDGLSGKVDDLYEVVTFIKDNVPMRDEVVMKSEFEGRMTGFENRMNQMESKMATKDDLAKLECRLVTKSYLDDKLANLAAEIGERVNRVKDKGKLFNQKLVNYLDRHTVFETSEINELKELI